MLILGEFWSTLNLGSHFATLLGLPLTMLIPGGQSTLNLRSHFATLLGLPLTMLILEVNQHSTWEVTLQLCWDYLWQCWSWGLIDTQLGKSLCNFAGITWQCWSWEGSINTQLGKSLCNFAVITSDNVDPRGVNQHSTWEVTLQLCWDYLCQCWSLRGGGQLTLNLGSHFATLLGLPLKVLILGVGSIDTQLGKSLCNFAGITSDSVDPGGQSTLNLGSHFATLLGLPLTVLIWGVNWHSTWEVNLQLCWDYLWQCWSCGGSNQHSTWEVTLQLCLDYLWQCWSWWGDNQHSTWKFTLQLCWDYLWQCLSWGINWHSTWEVTLQLCWDNLWQCWLLGGSIDTQLGKSLCNFAGITSDSVDPGGGTINTQLGNSLCNFAGITSDNVYPGGSIDTKLGKSLCNFVGITSDNVDPWGVNWHSTWEVTLQLCWDYLWQCWSWGVNWHSTWEVTLQLCWDYLWQCWSLGGQLPGGQLTWVWGPHQGTNVKFPQIINSYMLHLCIPCKKIYYWPNTKPHHDRLCPCSWKEVFLWEWFLWWKHGDLGRRKYWAFL